MTYLPRLADARLQHLLARHAAVCVDGMKAVGKTATAARQAGAVLAMDSPAEVELVRADPERLVSLPRPVLIDEWQRYPPVWDLVRRAVDSGAPPGSFILTGSASPRAAVHSGAGRIMRMRMRPLSIAERRIAQPTVSLAALLSGEIVSVASETSLGARDYAAEIVASGLPGLRGLDQADRADALDGYLDLVVEHDFAELGHVVRRPAALRHWLAAFAAATSSTASYSALLDAATPAEVTKPAKTTTIAYRDTLERLWIVDEVEPWPAGSTVLAAMTASPKHQLGDPALAARLLHADASRLLTDGTLFGALFEALATLSMRVYADAARARVAHLRTRGGDHEVDLIVEGDDGGVLGIEVKLARDVTTGDVRHLLWLRERLGTRFRDGIVLTTGAHAYRRRDGIAVVPLALLGP